jgi:hypothetical protein
MHWLSIVVLSVLCSVTYGVIHGQITARICVEYFTIGHRPILPTDDPTVLGFVWGVIATWWVGILLGVPLATVARTGSRPKLKARSLIGPLAALLACNALLAVLAGGAGYVAASNGWVRLIGPLSEAVPRERHVPFLADLWAHNASYLGGFLGGIMLMVWVWRSRGALRLRIVDGRGQDCPTLQEPGPC